MIETTTIRNHVGGAPPIPPPPIQRRERRSERDLAPPAGDPCYGCVDWYMYETEAGPSETAEDIRVRSATITVRIIPPR